jgi:hypothetical protein
MQCRGMTFPRDKDQNTSRNCRPLQGPSFLLLLKFLKLCAFTHLRSTFLKHDLRPESDWLPVLSHFAVTHLVVVCLTTVSLNFLAQPLLMRPRNKCLEPGRSQVSGRRIESESVGDPSGTPCVMHTTQQPSSGPPSHLVVSQTWQQLQVNVMT